LRTKRGHRKPSFLNNLGDGRAGSAFIQQGPVTLSPSSDAFSHNPADQSNPPRNSTPQAQGSKRQLPGTSNGHTNPANLSPTPAPRRPKNAFDLYCIELSSILSVKNRKGLADGTYDLEQELAKGWQSLDAPQKEDFQARFEKMKKEWDAEKETGGARRTDVERSTPTPAPAPRQTEDEDVEMTEGAGSPSVASGADTGGFTAVNRG
jgi:non-histone protein 10